MRKIAGSLVLCLSLVAVPGQSPRAQAEPGGPEVALRAYFTALQASDWDAVYALLSEASKNGQDLEEFKRRKSGPGSELSALINARSSYEILGTTLADDGKRAAVDLRIKAPEIKALFSPLGLPSAKTIAEAPLRETRQKIELVREGGRWKVERLPPKLPPEAVERMERAREADLERARQRPSETPAETPP
jgi:hypothetical protein